MLSQFSTSKQADLNLITDTLSAHPDVHFVILFEPAELNEKNADYNLLIILKHHAIHLQKKLTEKITKAITPKKKYLPTPQVNLIFHGIRDVNAKLTAGNQFFTDIKNTGTVLYDSEKHLLSDQKIRLKTQKDKKKKNLKSPLFSPKKLTSPFFKGRKQEGFSQKNKPKIYLCGGDNFYRGYHFFMENNLILEAAFVLHQTLESYCTAILIHYTDYRPKEHDLRILLDRVTVCNPALNIFSDLEEFPILCQAYVSARYHRDTYIITEDQLRNIEQKISEFREMVDDIFK